MADLTKATVVIELRGGLVDVVSDHEAVVVDWSVVGLDEARDMWTAQRVKQADGLDPEVRGRIVRNITSLWSDSIYWPLDNGDGSE